MLGKPRHMPANIGGTVAGGGDIAIPDSHKRSSQHMMIVIPTATSAVQPLYQR